MPTLQEALNTFLLIERRPQTNHQYGVILACMVRAIGPDRDLQLIRFEDLLDYQSRLRATRQPSTVTSYTAIIKAFFNWCCHRGYIVSSPAHDLPRIKVIRDPEDSRAIPSNELRRMVEYTRQTSPRNHAMLLFLCDTGCRVSGLVSLTIPHLHLDDHYAALEEKGGMWFRATFGDETAEALERWLKKRPQVEHDSVWTGRGPGHAPIKRQAVEQILRQLSVRTEASRTWSPHSLRHAVGHAWAKAGMPPHITQQKLGHAQITTTLQFYYPRRDPYVEVASQELALASLRDGEDLHKSNIIEISSTKKRAAR